MVADASERIREQLGDLVREAGVSHGVLVFELDPPALHETVARLKAKCGFDLFLDVTAVDWPGREPRFDVVYHFYSSAERLRVRLKTRVPESEPAVATLIDLYGSARFMERECHDMFGIEFRGNADLRPILLYEGFTGHPLRKDYPKDREQPLVPSRK
ncbi:MAG: NADH-quinone oxidoreductase subunit C [Steroidobacteraceae bacterium]|nr:NADH-quinone oxidoreductase subunit C [Steroidobacteraceae bacterium]MCC7198396.1 NADH-quinone oxidoreductase subunit C [Gammaproteobacteria bacterium]